MTAIQLANLREAKARAPQAFDKRRETWPETQSPLWLLNERYFSGTGAGGSWSVSLPFPEVKIVRYAP